MATQAYLISKEVNKIGDYNFNLYTHLHLDMDTVLLTTHVAKSVNQSSKDLTISDIKIFIVAHSNIIKPHEIWSSKIDLKKNGHGKSLNE